VKNFWIWFFSRPDGGLIRFVNWWLLLHFFVGVILSLVVPVSLSEAAKTVLLPLASILVGLAFAWAGNAQALLRSKEIDELSAFVAGGFETYAYTFQAAILCLLISVSAWGLAGLCVFDGNAIGERGDRLAAPILYGLASMALRECWHVVLGAQSLLLAARRIQQSKRRK